MTAVRGSSYAIKTVSALCTSELCVTMRTMARPAKRTKIVATIGPASESEDMLARLMEAGMDVVRLNFSHRSAEQAKPLVERDPCVAHKLGVSFGLLGDLQGPP